MNDILLIIGNSKLRAKVRNLLARVGNDFRFLDEASAGNIGLEKAYMLNPDIIILEAWAGIVDGYYIVNKLRQKNYNCKILMIDTVKNNNKLNDIDVCGVLSEDELNESQLRDTLIIIANAKMQNTEIITRSVFHDIMECDSVTDFSLINDKYDLNLDIKSPLHVATCRILDDATSTVAFITNHITEIKKIINRYSGGLVFSHKKLIYFVLNYSQDTRRLLHDLFLYMKNAMNSEIYFIVSNNANSLSALKEQLENAPDLNKYGFFRTQIGIQYEGYIEENRGEIPYSVIDKLIRNIQYDIREQDIRSLNTDINHLFLKQIKYKMDFHAYNYAYSRLVQLHSDILTLQLTYENTVFSHGHENYIEETADLLCECYARLIYALNPKLIENTLVQDAIDYIRAHYSENVTLKDVASKINVSAPYLSALFKQNINKNFTDYLLDIRLQRAKDLIAEKRYRIYEIAEMTGFKNVKYFSRVFKENSHYTPRDYQNRIVNNIGIGME